MIFNDYTKTQIDKFKIIAGYAKGRVLDVGTSQASNNYLSESPLVKEVYMLDKSRPEYVIETRKFCTFDLNAIFKNNMPFEDNYFDTVILGDVLEHLLFPFAVLKDAQRILNSEGVMIISSPSPKYYLEAIYQALFGKPMDFPEHRFLLTRVQFRDTLAKIGIRVQKEIGYSFWLPIVKIGFVNNTGRRLPECITWQQIFICKKTT